MLKVSKIAMVASAVLLANLQPLQAAGIGGLGIQYDQMPVGTAAFYKKYDDDSWTDVYVGKKGGKYIVKRYDGNKTSGRKIAHSHLMPMEEWCKNEARLKVRPTVTGTNTALTSAYINWETAPKRLFSLAKVMSTAAKARLGVSKPARKRAGIVPSIISQKPGSLAGAIPSSLESSTCTQSNNGALRERTVGLS